MEYLIFIGTLAFLGLAINYYKNNILYKKTPFYKLKKRVEEDLEYANFNNDWRKRQEAELKLLWLDIILKDERQDSLNILFKQEPKTEYEIMKGVLSSDLKFPQNYEADNLLHLKFTEKMTQDYAKFWVNEFDYKKMLYKPESILQHPKKEMIKAIMFFLNNASYSEKVKENIDALLQCLPRFIAIEPSQLPTTLFENIKVGEEWEKKYESK